MIIYVMLLVVLLVFGWMVVWWCGGGELVRQGWCFAHFTVKTFSKGREDRLVIALFYVSDRGVGIVRVLLV